MSVHINRSPVMCSLVAALTGTYGCSRIPPPPERTAAHDVAAVNALISSATEDQRARLRAPFDTLHRLQWYYIPRDRPGLALAHMTDAQRGYVPSLLHSALSDAGVGLAEAIMRHEDVLKAHEARLSTPPRFTRDPSLYYVSVFGEPANLTPWGWRFEGHHLSINVTRVPGAPQIVAPLFMGASPARVTAGPDSGLRLMAGEEDLARALIRSLPSNLRRTAMLADTTFGDIVSRNDPVVRSVEMRGVRASEMPAEQQQLVRRLIELHVSRMDGSSAREQLGRMDSAGLGNVRFGWAGSLDPEKPHYYRLHGPTFLIEYDNTQSEANHVHTVWRDLQRDFGGDLLRAHYRRHLHSPPRGVP